MKNQENKVNQNKISDNDLKQVTGGVRIPDSLLDINGIAVAPESVLIAVDTDEDALPQEPENLAASTY